MRSSQCVVKVLDLSTTTDLVEFELRIMEMLCGRESPHRALVVTDGSGQHSTGTLVSMDETTVLLKMDHLLPEGAWSAASRACVVSTFRPVIVGDGGLRVVCMHSRAIATTFLRKVSVKQNFKAA